MGIDFLILEIINKSQRVKMSCQRIIIYDIYKSRKWNNGKEMVVGFQ